MSVRGIHTDVTDMREKIFTEVARLAYEGGDYSRLEELPYKIVPGELASFRESVFTERAIVGERLRLAIGLPNRTLAEHAPVAGHGPSPAGCVRAYAAVRRRGGKRHCREILRSAADQHHQVCLS